MRAAIALRPDYAISCFDDHQLEMHTSALASLVHNLHEEKTKDLAKIIEERIAQADSLLGRLSATSEGVSFNNRVTMAKKELQDLKKEVLATRSFFEQMNAEEKLKLLSAGYLQK
jgi:hypothetical protein